MALQLPANYPTGCTDAQLQQTIDAIYADIVATGANVKRVEQLTPLAQSGQNELMHRHVRRAQEAAAAARADSAQANNRALTISKRSLVVSLVAGILSIVLSGVAAYFAWEASSSSTRWEARQVPILEQVRDETVRQRGELREALREQSRLLDEAIKGGRVATERGNSDVRQRK